MSDEAPEPARPARPARRRPAAEAAAPPWWERRSPSVLTFVGLLLVLVLLGVGLGFKVKRALGDVGRNVSGTDPWTAPVGIERLRNGVLVGALPACAEGPVQRIMLWDGDSHVLWDVSGAPTPLTTFFVGVAPPGFKTLRAYRKPSSSLLVRLVVVRRLVGVAGGRYVTKDLRFDRVTLRDPTDVQHTYTTTGFTKADVCPTANNKHPSGSTDGSTIPSGVNEPG